MKTLEPQEKKIKDLTINDPKFRLLYKMYLKARHEVWKKKHKPLSQEKGK